MAYTTIKKASDYFNTVLWEGNNTSGRQITGVGFEPDLVWLKNRTSSANHGVHTQISGVDGAEYLTTNGTNAITTSANHVPSFDSDGFTINNGLMLNDTSNNYVAWNWLGANASSSNTDGSITSTVSANTTSGFSIVSYTGTGANATVGHGLSSAPSMIIVKKRNVAGGNWQVYHSSIGNTGAIQLNLTNATGTAIGYWNNTSPTSSVFSLGAGADVNGNTQTFIAYCFAEKKGFSKFGSYTGNGNADGTFIYTGFKPAFVIIKKTNAAGSWWMDDNKRDTFNPTLKALEANSNAAESADGAGDLDFLSNGFKCRDNTDAINVSGGSYIYMAFADEPLVGDNPATAR